MIEQAKLLGADQLRVGFDSSGVPAGVITVIDLAGLRAVDIDRLTPLLLPQAGRRIVIGISDGALSDEAAQLLPLLSLTLVSSDPGWGDPMWVRVDDPIATALSIADRANMVPRAALVADGLLRITAALPTEEAMTAESIAYSMLLGGPEFARWRRERATRPLPASDHRVMLNRSAERLDVTLDNPSRRNAFDARMHAALTEAMRLPLVDASITEVFLRANGPDFSSGGDLDEFGSAQDLAAAHAVRLEQSAGLGVHRVASRVRAVLRGWCIGAGIEVPAFAGRVAAASDVKLMLPELGMGLVPGAGGTVSVTRRIGRWRAAHMILSGAAIGFAEALDWGLVDELG